MMKPHPPLSWTTTSAMRATVFGNSLFGLTSDATKPFANFVSFLTKSRECTLWMVRPAFPSMDFMVELLTRRDMTVRWFSSIVISCTCIISSRSMLLTAALSLMHATTKVSSFTGSMPPAERNCMTRLTCSGSTLMVPNSLSRWGSSLCAWKSPRVTWSAPKMRWRLRQYFALDSMCSWMAIASLSYRFWIVFCRKNAMTMFATMKLTM
mmetsp:Transcript_18099/g.51299  ORF Transcript_18099/g.51299 Transcript_18099/m.51299 type:complete len:209 (+) Transcript_18099:556-1182(+)